MKLGNSDQPSKLPVIRQLSVVAGAMTSMTDQAKNESPRSVGRWRLRIEKAIRGRRCSFLWLALAVAAILPVCPHPARAQSPELAMRDFSSGQIKKGVRTMGLGAGSDHAVFTKIAMPLGQGFSVGILLAYETAQFDATGVGNPQHSVHYETEWRPSPDFGLAWQPSKAVL